MELGGGQRGPGYGQAGGWGLGATPSWSPPSAPRGTRGLPRVLAPSPGLAVTDTNVALAPGTQRGLAQRQSLIFGPQGTGWMSSERSTL